MELPCPFGLGVNHGCSSKENPMNTILVLVVLASILAALTIVIRFVVKDHINTLKEKNMHKPVLVNFAREIGGILAIGLTLNILMVAVVITGTGSAIVGKIVQKTSNTAYEAAYQSWKADQAWRAAADRRIAGTQGADSTPIDALVSVANEKLAWEKANVLQVNENKAFEGLQAFEAMEADIKAVEDRWMKRIQNW